MAKLYNLARMTTATAGTGTITLGAAVSGYLTFAQAGVANGDVVDYAIRDGSDSEIGTGTYTSSGTSLTRTVTKSTNSNSALSLSGAAEVFISPRAETLNDASLFTSGVLANGRMGASSIGTSGYYTLPGGLIIQWGFASAPAATITFPLTFPNHIYSFTANNAPGATAAGPVSIISLSTSAASIDSSNSSLTKRGVYWMAIGN